MQFFLENLSGLLFAEDAPGGTVWWSWEFLCRLRDTCGGILKEQGQ